MSEPIDSVYLPFSAEQLEPHLASYYRKLWIDAA